MEKYIINAAEYEELKKERDILKQLMFEVYHQQQQQQQLPEMLQGAHPGRNHQLEYHMAGLNQPESCVVAPGFPQMVNQNFLQFGGGDSVDYFNSLNPKPS